MVETMSQDLEGETHMFAYMSAWGSMESQVWGNSMVHVRDGFSIEPLSLVVLSTSERYQ